MLWRQERFVTLRGDERMHEDLAVLRRAHAANLGDDWYAARSRADRDRLEELERERLASPNPNPLYPLPTRHAPARRLAEDPGREIRSRRMVRQETPEELLAMLEAR